MKLFLKICYDGTFFKGYQYQPGERTVQGTLTDTVSRLMGFDCTVTGCSRTDSGVHALGFCAAIEPAEESKRGDGWCSIPAEKIPTAINSFLPEDISVVGAEYVSDDFHPRYSVVWKEYEYLIHDGKYPNPFERNHMYHIKNRIDDGMIEKMNRVAKLLVGRHDFSSFKASGSSVKDSVRNLMRLEVVRKSEDVVAVYARADGFLYNMVRILTGTLLEAAAGRFDEEDIIGMLSAEDRRAAGKTAPAHGLYLKEVNYGKTLDKE